MNQSPYASALGHLRILVVDDHAINREFLSAGLSRLVDTVSLADSGVVALELCQQQRFDVILLDLHMPKMDGLSTAQRIRESEGPSADALLVVLTADTRPEEKERLLASVFDGYLNKPIGIPDLAEAIAALYSPGLARAAITRRQLGSHGLLNREGALATANQDPELAQRLAGMLGEEIRDRLASLDQMLASGEAKAAGALLHQWAGASGFAGAANFGQRCRSLRQSLVDEDSQAFGAAYLHFLRSALATSQALLKPAN
ncbi:MAG: response regulator [Wenzhouxiangella sp.]